MKGIYNLISYERKRARDYGSIIALLGSLKDTGNFQGHSFKEMISMIPLCVFRQLHSGA